MVRRGGLVSLVLVAALVTAAPAAQRLPPLSFEDQEGRALSLAALRGGVVVIVYGTRDAIDDSIAWGRRLAAERPATAPPPAEILAVAQIGGVPAPFHGVVRAAVRQRMPASFSLWLDWDDRLGAIFGRHQSLPTVVVVDRDGDVRLVVVGRSDGASWDAVIELLRRLR